MSLRPQLALGLRGGGTGWSLNRVREEAERLPTKLSLRLGEVNC